MTKVTAQARHKQSREAALEEMSILGYPYLNYEELSRMHWCALLKLAKASQRF